MELLNVSSLHFGLIRRKYSKPEKDMDEYFVMVLRVGTLMVHLFTSTSNVNSFSDIKNS